MSWHYNRIVNMESDDTLAKYFQRVLDETDFVFCLYGRKNKGKSWASMSLGEDICPGFSEKNVVSTLEQFYERMENGGSEEHRVMCLDDFGSELDPSEYMFDPGKKTSHYFQKSRTLHTGYILTTPNRMFFTKTIRERLADYQGEILWNNRQTGETCMKVQRTQINVKTDRIFYHNLFMSDDGLINHEGMGRKMPEHIIFKPTDGLISWYLPMRDSLAKAQLQQSAKEVKRAVLKKENIEVIAAKVAKRMEHYSKITLGKTVLNRDLVCLDFGIGGRRVLQVEAWLKIEGFIKK